MSSRAKLRLPSAPSGHAPGIHTPEEVRMVLETARKADPDILRHLAVRYFAGVRSAEAHRMVEANILLDRGFIEVPTIKAKTRGTAMIGGCRYTYVAYRRFKVAQ